MSEPYYPSDVAGSSPFLAPDFSLTASDGVNEYLYTLRYAAPVVVVFYRGHWCPYCCRYLEKLQANMDRFSAAGATLIAISPEPIATSRDLARRLSLTFPLLSDADGKVIDAYGVRNRFTSARTRLPHPAVFVIDPGGMIRFRSVDRNYKKRTTMRTIFGEIDQVLGAIKR